MVSRFNNIIYWAKVNKRLVVFLVVLILLAAFLRLYNLSHLLYWMFDEERDAFVVKRILVDKHFPLIGGAVPGAFYLAPGYFYISAIIYLFSHLNPIGPAVVASLLGTISTVLLFFVTKTLFDKKTAVSASLIYCASYLAISYNRTWWPLTFGPTLAMLTYYCLHKIIIQKRIKWVILLSPTFIVGAQSDPSNFSLIILAVIFWIFYRLPLRNKYVLIAVFLFVFSHLPLLLFDLRHNFFNVRNVIHLLTFHSATTRYVNLSSAALGLKIFPETLARYLFVSTRPDFALQIVPEKFYLDQKLASIPKLTLVISAAVIIYFIFKCVRAFTQKDNFGIKVIGTNILIALVGIFFYNLAFPGYTHEWFFQVLFPAFSIIIALMLTAIAKIKNLAFVSYFILASFLFISLFAFAYARNSYNFGDKSAAVKWAIKEVAGQPFSLDSIGKSFRYGGYRYLFYLYGHEPVKSYIDSVFADWMYPKSSLWDHHPDKVVVIASPDFYYDPEYQTTYDRYLSYTIKKRKFGRIEVLIIDNSAKWVNW